MVAQTASTMADYSGTPKVALMAARKAKPMVDATGYTTVESSAAEMDVCSAARSVVETGTMWAE